MTRDPRLATAVLIALAGLAGCAAHTASTPPAAVPTAAAEEAAAPDPNIKPLTQEQEEQTAE